MTAAYALTDLWVYDSQLESMFPQSGITYPADSLSRLRRERAARWVERLRRLMAHNDSGVAGWQLVPFAEVAVRAEDDTLARRLFDARIAEVANNPAARAYVLAEAVSAFADQTQDSVRLNRNLPIAERYAELASALPAAGFSGGYRAKNDSATVMYQQWRVEDSLLATADARVDIAHVLVHAARIYAIAPRFSPEERQPVISKTYMIAAGALMLRTADSVAAHRSLDSLNARVLNLAGIITPGWLPDETPAVRTRRAAEMTQSTRSLIQQIAESFALLGTHAPPLIAHTWFNAPDSEFHAEARSYPFTNGNVHVLLLGDISDATRLSILERVQQGFHGKAQGILATATRGYTGPVITTPRDEVSWLRQYLIDLRHFSMPVAVWAGPKRQVSAMVGDGTAYVPRQSPLDTSSYRHRAASFLLIDRDGVIRSSVDATNRYQEISLRRRIERLVQESAAHVATSPVTAAPDSPPSTAIADSVAPATRVPVTVPAH